MPRIWKLDGKAGKKLRCEGILPSLRREEDYSARSHRLACFFLLPPPVEDAGLGCVLLGGWCTHVFGKKKPTVFDCTLLCHESFGGSVLCAEQFCQGRLVDDGRGRE